MGSSLSSRVMTAKRSLDRAVQRLETNADLYENKRLRLEDELKKYDVTRLEDTINQRINVIVSYKKQISRNRSVANKLREIANSLGEMSDDLYMRDVLSVITFIQRRVDYDLNLRQILEDFAYLKKSADSIELKGQKLQEMESAVFKKEDEKNDDTYRRQLLEGLQARRISMIPPALLSTKPGPKTKNRVKSKNDLTLLNKFLSMKLFSFFLRLFLWYIFGR